MAATIPADFTSKIIRMVMVDVQNERLNKTFILDGAMDDADVAILLDDFMFITNAACESCTMSSTKTITGLRTSPLNTLERNVSNQLALGFNKVSPLNPAKTVDRSFIVPAYNSAVQQTGTNVILYTVPTPATPTNEPGHLARLIDALAANLQYEAADGDFYPGDWDFDTVASGFATVPNVIDGA